MEQSSFLGKIFKEIFSMSKSGVVIVVFSQFYLHSNFDKNLTIVCITFNIFDKLSNWFNIFTQVII